MNAATETTLDNLTFARNMRLLRAEENGRSRRMAIRNRADRRGGMASVFWWLGPISWATILGTVCVTADAWQSTLNFVLVTAGF